MTFLHMDFFFFFFKLKYVKFLDGGRFLVSLFVCITPRNANNKCVLGEM